MLVGDWNQIRIKLQNTISEIFKDCSLDDLSDYEKRKMIFDFPFVSLRRILSDS